MKEDIILKQYEMLPDSLKKEVLDFIGFLLFKYQQKPTFKNKKKPVFGSLKGKIILSKDFDEPLEDLKDFM
jgi:hypothetical protein